MCPELERAKPGDVVKYDHYWEWTDGDGRVVTNFAWNMECLVLDVFEFLVDLKHL
jgi:hypothetical protein